MQPKVVMPKGALGSKTLWFAAALTILGALQQTSAWDWLPEQWAGVVVSIIGVIVMWLRSITTTSVTLVPPSTPDRPGEGEG